MKHFEFHNAMTVSRPHPRRFAWILGAVLLASMFVLNGCLSRPPLNKQTFSFNLPVATNGVTRVATGSVLGIKTLRIAPPFDGRSLIYRTGEFSYESDPYATFLDPPADALFAPVCALLRDDGCFSAVVKTGSTVRPEMLLEITINQLYGDIRQPGSPCAVLGMDMTFIQATNGLPGQLIFQRDYSRRIPMKSSNPAALMLGWNQALNEIFANAAADFQNLQVAR